MEEGKGTVCVTGGTGHVGSWLVKMLLEQGYSVHTTVRQNPETKRDMSFLTKLPGADERLKIFEADLHDPNSFEAAIEGCNGVLHVATPIDFQDNEPEPVVTKRTIDGALGILKSCLKSKTVKRVVYTSSSHAVFHNRNDNVDMMDETFWTEPEFAREMNFLGSSYAISKTLTERACIEFGEQHGLEVVTVLCSLVVGPFICPKFPGSVNYALSPILGMQVETLSYVLLNIPLVHIDDLSRAHIFLLEHPNAKGRYICCSHNATIPRIVEILSKYPEFTVPTADSLERIKHSKKTADLSSKKLLDLGFQYKYGIEDMYAEAIKCCKERGYL